MTWLLEGGVPSGAGDGAHTPNPLFSALQEDASEGVVCANGFEEELEDSYVEGIVCANGFEDELEDGDLEEISGVFVEPGTDFIGPGVELLSSFDDGCEDAVCCVAMHPSFPTIDHVAFGGCDDKAYIHSMSSTPSPPQPGSQFDAAPLYAAQSTSQYDATPFYTPPPPPDSPHPPDFHLSAVHPPSLPNASFQELQGQLGSFNERDAGNAQAAATSMMSRESSNTQHTLVATLADSSETVSCLEYSHDGKYLATGCYDGVVRIYLVSPLLHSLNDSSCGLVFPEAASHQSQEHTQPHTHTEKHPHTQAQTHPHTYTQTPQNVEGRPQWLEDAYQTAFQLGFICTTEDGVPGMVCADENLLHAHRQSSPLQYEEVMRFLRKPYTLYTELRGHGGGGDVEWIQWHPKGYVLLAGFGEGGASCMWWVPSGKLMQSFMWGHGGSVSCGCFAMGGRCVCTAGDDGSLAIWDPKTGGILHRWRGLKDAPQGGGGGNMQRRGGGWNQPLSSGVLCVSAGVGSASSLLAVGTVEGGGAKIIDVSSGRLLHTFSVEGLEGVEALSWLGGEGSGLSEFQLLAIGDSSGKILVGDTKRMTLISTFSLPPSGEGLGNLGITRIRWFQAQCRVENAVHTHVSYQPMVVCSTADGLVCVWEGRSGTLVEKFTAHTGAVMDLQLKAVYDSVIAFTCGEDGMTRVWRLPVCVGMSS